MFHVEGCRVVAQLCQLGCGSATPRGQALIISHVLTSLSSGTHSVWCGWPAAVKVWLTHLEAGTRASHAARLFMRRQRPPRRPARTRDPARPDAGNQSNPPGASVDNQRQNKPRPFFCLSLPSASHTMVQPDCWCRQVNMPKAAGWSYRGSNTIWRGLVPRHITSYV